MMFALEGPQWNLTNKQTHKRSTISFSFKFFYSKSKDFIYNGHQMQPQNAKSIPLHPRTQQENLYVEQKTCNLAVHFFTTC